jgi:hypothetical protein
MFCTTAKPTGFGGESTINAKAHFRPNTVNVRSTCLSPQLEVNHPHPLGRLCAFIVGVEPPPKIAGLTFIRQNESEGVSANINVSLPPNMHCYLAISNLLTHSATR